MSFRESLDTVKIVLNTAYQGARIATGGGFFDGLFNYPATLLFPISELIYREIPASRLFLTFFQWGFFVSMDIA